MSIDDYPVFQCDYCNHKIYYQYDPPADWTTEGNKHRCGGCTAIHDQIANSTIDAALEIIKSIKGDKIFVVDGDLPIESLYGKVKKLKTKEG